MTTEAEWNGTIRGDNFGRSRKESCNMTRKKVEEMLMTIIPAARVL